MGDAFKNHGCKYSPKFLWNPCHNSSESMLPNGAPDGNYASNDSQQALRDGAPGM